MSQEEKKEEIKAQTETEKERAYYASRPKLEWEDHLSLDSSSAEE